MATWVIGDVHGCWLTLERLLQRIEWRPDRDELWFVGDLVNRGPASLEVLRWASRNRSSIEVVLGNHDLHLLSVAAGVRGRKSGDTLDEILNAPDRDDLLKWLRTRPLVHHAEAFVMVHAGLLPEWTIEGAGALADAAAESLAGGHRRSFLRSLFKSRKRGEQNGQSAESRLVAAVIAMTRLRMVDADGRPQLGYSGSPGEAPRGWRPWFEASAIRGQGCGLVFGHWAMLGLYRERDVTCIDSGCVYGGSLTALHLQEGRVVQESLADDVVNQGGPT